MKVKQSQKDDHCDILEFFTKQLSPVPRIVYV